MEEYKAVGTEARMGEVNSFPMEELLSALFNTLPCCSAGALVF
jgi:hypothetical protein